MDPKRLVEQNSARGTTPSFLDIVQSEVLLREFENILTIKRGKLLSPLKVEQLYHKIHLIEDIVAQLARTEGVSLDLA